MNYHGATICLNGHVLSKYDTHSNKFCSICGSTTISYCLSCKRNINGLSNPSGIAVVGKRPYTKPNYCEYCGEPHPWTQTILDNAIELLALDTELDQPTKDIIKTAIPNLLVDTPLTPVAVAKYQTGIEKTGKIIKDGLYNLLVDVASDTAKKTLFPE